MLQIRMEIDYYEMIGGETMSYNENNILEIRDLTVKFLYDEGTIYAVNGVNYSVPEGKSIGIVGESGCGKTVSSYSIIKLLSDNAKVSGEILYKESDGNITDIVKLKADGKDMRRI